MAGRNWWSVSITWSLIINQGIIATWQIYVVRISQNIISESLRPGLIIFLPWTVNCKFLWFCFNFLFVFCWVLYCICFFFWWRKPFLFFLFFWFFQKEGRQEVVIFVQNLLKGIWDVSLNFFDPSFDSFEEKETLRWLFRMFWWKKSTILALYLVALEARCTVFMLWLLLLLFPMLCLLLSSFESKCIFSLNTLFLIWEAWMVSWLM